MIRKGKVTILFCLVVLVAGTAMLYAQSRITDFGFTQDDLQNGVVNSLFYGRITIHPDKKLFKAAAPQVQAAFVKNTLSFIKSYTESSAFRTEYEKKRLDEKPTEPSQGSPDEQYGRFVAEQKQSLEEMKKTYKTLPPDMQKQMQSTIEEMEANIKRMTDNPQMAAMLQQGYEQNALDEKRNYSERLDQWKQNYPEDPERLIATRLREFLDLCKDIPYDAKLVSNGRGKMKFANPAYESMPGSWKQCYRIGREPMQAARTFALEWLRQIEKK
ncbi:MAG: hypothetical protein KBA28_02275 [Syntrophaceae bacterium]|jgi:hypothetical protein|nr:hypothetical protein [Syntrophaceae bacterium]HOC58348.1 hypothetical protein [Smithellaceae bacterium]HQM44770.1 hypothetical protein [Smithellaceae bacterium]